MKDKISLISDAIKLRRPIMFEYQSPADSTRGRRVGNPYVLHYPSNDDHESKVLLSLFQTSGVSKSGHSNGWKEFDVQYISGLSIVEGDNIFPINSEYKPNSNRYNRSIIKV
jgi:hypothetical protein